jgi:YidC/Oxa1 family membrane protein insertase
MHLAWGPLDWLAKFMLVALIMLKSFCGSYGWSIIVLTIIVRVVFWPVTQKANNSMKKMQKLQPKVAEIKEKFKDNPQQMNAKVMELYKIEKVNPLGGCLPILLQIPVFFALYATLDGAVELRQVSFLWAADLSRPDTIAVIFGVPLNPLVLVMTALMVLQQKMTPAPADPMQQKMMMFMPVVMLFVLYSLPSGLTLYWTVSQVFSILQLYMTQKMGKVQPAADKSQKNNLKKA